MIKIYLNVHIVFSILLLVNKLDHVPVIILSVNFFEMREGKISFLGLLSVRHPKFERGVNELVKVGFLLGDFVFYCLFYDYLPCPSKLEQSHNTALTLNVRMLSGTYETL